jgi:glutamyl-tRNA synthetase
LNFLNNNLQENKTNMKQKFSSDYYSEIESKIPSGNARTRFAPSPTGYMHLGNLRTALYTYLLAKKLGGVFILRIEDTDQERFVDGATEIIYNTLADVGIIHDEGPDIGGPAAPYIQSERKETYKPYAELLIEKGHAYRCFCDKETLDEQRKIHEASRIPHKYDGRCSLLSEEETDAKLTAGTQYVVRQKVPKEGSTSFTDLIYGRIEVENSTLDDQILLKSDGMPTYNFANVVDDHLMGITHVMRGNEYLSSAPKYNLLYEAFGWQVPEYVHVSQIMRDASRKLSKRDGDAYYNDFIEKGYLKEAIINYVALLGWSPGTEEEKFTLEELEKAFDIKGISKSPAIFDYKKLNWLNAAYLRAMTAEEFHAIALPYIKEGVKRDIDTAYAAGVLQERCEFLSAIPEQLDFIDALPEYPQDLYINKKMKTDVENSREALVKLLPALENISGWQEDMIHGEVFGLIEKLGVKNGLVLYPMRVALSGKAFTPGGGIEIAVLLGKDETLRRIKKAIERL